jgi:hypothetical protein
MQRDEGDRPSHLTVDVRQDVVMEMPLTDAEWDAIEAKSAAVVAEAQRREADDERLRAAVAAHPDALVRELAGRLGLGPVGGP